MALRAFSNNPGIGGFGESTPVLFHGDTIDTRKRNERRQRQRQKQNKDTASSFNTKTQVLERSSGDGDDNSDDGSTTNRGYSNGDGDLLCQIIKELVDNAVDACRSPYNSECGEHNEERGENYKKRIRVDIRPPATNGGFNDNSTAASSSKEHRDGVLQVTVSDNGCGMENIQNCVNAFQSSKGGSQVTSNYNNNNNNSNSSSSSNHTSGRYGIGLTLCLLHAQRCVPNSRACISSATSKSKYRTRAFFEVDKQGDSVDCVQEEVTPMSNNSTTSEQVSGTCVSLLVPVSD